MRITRTFVPIFQFGGFSNGGRQCGTAATGAVTTAAASRRVVVVVVIITAAAITIARIAVVVAFAASKRKVRTRLGGHTRKSRSRVRPSWCCTKAAAGSKHANHCGIGIASNEPGNVGSNRGYNSTVAFCRRSMSGGKKDPQHSQCVDLFVCLFGGNHRSVSRNFGESYAFKTSSSPQEGDRTTWKKVCRSPEISGG